ncbi:MAG: hypothetical protein U0575_17395 [Phycisphaerales bacterium]
MNLSTFLAHHGLATNPFAAEEARQDEVFARLEEVEGNEFRHPDFDKIAGDLARPGSAVVFGERGTGKTAIRLQLARRIAEHNRVERTHRVMSIVHDDFDAMLRAMARRGGDPVAALRTLTLSDHMDAILQLAVPALVDRILDPRSGDGAPAGAVQLQLDDDARRRARELDPRVRDGLLVLQACYDRPDGAARRTSRLRRRLRRGAAHAQAPLLWLAGLLAAAAVAAAIIAITFAPGRQERTILDSGAAALGLIAVLSAAIWGWRWLVRARLASRLSRALRVADRPAEALRASLGALPRLTELATHFPGPPGAGSTAASGAGSGAASASGSDDERRFAMFAKLLEALRGLGHSGIIVMVDRVDEPMAVAGDVERMRLLIWPLLSSRFLQQDGVGVKLLLPLDLRPHVMRESTEFFRGARLDKQNFVDRLGWAGATLYDLCTARINACRAAGAAPISLMSFFDEGMRQQDVVDALDQLQQPRDAMKFLYALVQEHCTATPEESPQWRIPKPTFDAVRRRQVERMQEMLKGVRPG